MVGAGDQVDIELWAEFDPYREGFAAAVFSIGTGDHFFTIGDVNIDPLDGYGLNPLFLSLGDNGTVTDSDHSGVIDIVDDIFAFQLASGWGVDFDASNPIQVYSFGWKVAQTPTMSVDLIHGPTLNGEFNNAVYLDDFGEYTEYQPVSEILRFIPTPPTCGVIGCAMFLAMSNRRRPH